MKIKIIILLICFILPLSALANNQRPIETIKTTVDFIIETLQQNNMSPENRNHCQSIWQNIKSKFNFEEISKRTLAHNWSNFSKSEKKTFSNIFGEFLGKIYIDKIKIEYNNEKVLYNTEVYVNEVRSIVKTKIISKTATIPVDYKLIKINNIWQIYDVMVEGISLVANYRSQFKAILKKETPTQLIQKIKEKVAIQNQKNY